EGDPHEGRGDEGGGHPGDGQREHPAAAGQQQVGLGGAVRGPSPQGGSGAGHVDRHDQQAVPTAIAGGTASTLIARSAPTLGSTTNARCMAPRRVAARAVAVPAASPSESTKGPVSSGARSVSTPTL